MRISVTYVLFIFLSGSCAAQTLTPGGAPQAPLGSNTEHISIAIDFLANIKKAVLENHRGEESSAYKALSIRFFQCAGLYGVLLKNRTEPVAVTEFGNASAVFNLASGFIYPDGIENYIRDVVKAQAEVLEMVKTKNERKTFYMLRNCKDFWNPQASTVINAINEVMLR